MQRIINSICLVFCVLPLLKCTPNKVIRNQFINSDSLYVEYYIPDYFQLDSLVKQYDEGGYFRYDKYYTSKVDSTLRIVAEYTTNTKSSYDCDNINPLLDHEYREMKYKTTDSIYGAFIKKVNGCKFIEGNKTVDYYHLVYKLTTYVHARCFAIFVLKDDYLNSDTTQIVKTKDSVFNSVYIPAKYPGVDEKLVK